VPLYFAVTGKGNTKLRRITGRLVMALVVGEDLSKRINSLRFLLIVFVVFIHNNPTEVNFADGTEIYTIPAYVNIVRELISNIIARIAVPLFFLVSGYLLYAKETKFITVLKKKSRTILLPYISWNVLAIVFFYIAQSFSFTKPYFANIIIRNFKTIDWIDAFIGKFTAARQYQYPLVSQFWFLRDLFILNLSFIGIKKLVDRFPFGTIFFLFVLWTSSIKIYIVSTEALLFFTLGYYVIKYSLDYKTFDTIKYYDIVVIYITAIILELFFIKYVPIIHKINIIIGIILFIKLTYYFINNEFIYNKLLWLEKYAFFVYAVHGIALAILQKLSVKIIPMRGFLILLQYFSVNIIGIIFFVLLGVMARKLFPKLYGILTGGRI
jgi:fucose 4-O-acetylase-like acetyltransferase